MSAHLELATYRDAGREPTSPPAIHSDRVWTSFSAFTFWLCGVLGVGAIAIARVVEEPRERVFAALLATLLLHVSIIGAVVLADRWRWEQALATWLGGTAWRSPRRLVSEDGLRIHCAELDDLTESPADTHGHFEELTPQGLVARSCVQRTWPVRKPTLLGPTTMAHVRPARWEPRCFRGLPWKPDSITPFRQPAVLMVRVVDDGVLLTRFAEDRQFAGETLHATLRHAEAQIEDELGITEPDWCEVPAGSVESFSAEA